MFDIAEAIRQLAARVRHLETVELTVSGAPAAHKTSHQDGGSDEISVAGLSGVLADAQTPAAHKASHQDGGADEISVAGLSGTLADAQTPAAHKTNHQYGGSDEISLAGLAGALGWLQLTSNSQTISGGVITTTSSLCTLDTEGAASTDDLDTINGAPGDGTILILRTTSNVRDVVVTESGNIALAATTRTLSHRQDTLTLMYHSGTAVWEEIAFGDNGT